MSAATFFSKCARALPKGGNSNFFYIKYTCICLVALPTSVILGLYLINHSLLLVFMFDYFGLAKDIFLVLSNH